ALRKASDEGHGRARGSNPGIKHTELRKVVPGLLGEITSRRMPNEHRIFSAKEVEDAMLWIGGADVTPPDWAPKLLEKSAEAYKAEREKARMAKKAERSEAAE